MGSRICAGIEAVASRGALLVFVLTLGTLLVGCGNSEYAPDLAVPPSPEEASTLVVRVSGTEGIVYSVPTEPLQGRPSS